MIFHELLNAGIHNTLVTAVIQGGLLETLQGEGPFTVFAPTDQAFTDAGMIFQQSANLTS